MEALDRGNFLHKEVEALEEGFDQEKNVVDIVDG